MVFPCFQNVLYKHSVFIDFPILGTIFFVLRRKLQGNKIAIDVYLPFRGDGQK